jgi:hypothetical protein
VDNLSLWNKFEKTDPKYTKNFQRSGGFSGTAINPMYSAWRMTEVFGPCGTGWGAEEIRSVIVEGLDGDKVWHSLIRVWYIHDGERREIQQWGATPFCGYRRAKPGQDRISFVDEEAAKKAFTDGETKCFSLIGLGADIYLGHHGKQQFDDKWTSEPEPAPAVKEESAFEKAKKVIPKMKDLTHAKMLGAIIQTRRDEKAISLPEATQLTIMWTPYSLEKCKEVEEAYEVLRIVEEFNKAGFLSEGLLSDLSSACMAKVKELS